MSFPEILEAVQSLTLEEKSHLMRVLVPEAVRDLDTSNDADLIAHSFPPGVVHEISTPYDCHEAAAILTNLLEKSKERM